MGRRPRGPRRPPARRVHRPRGRCVDGSYAGLNLGFHVGDDPGAVAENRRLLELEAPGLAWMDQVHGDALAAARAGVTAKATDALVVDPGAGRSAAASWLADCVPLLLLTGNRPLAAAVHVGAAAFSPESRSRPWTSCEGAEARTSRRCSARRSAADATRSRRPCETRPTPSRRGRGHDLVGDSLRRHPPRPRPATGVPGRGRGPPARRLHLRGPGVLLASPRLRRGRKGRAFRRNRGGNSRHARLNRRSAEKSEIRCWGR